MTAAELRAALASVPDETPVLVRAAFDANVFISFDDGAEVVVEVNAAHAKPDGEDEPAVLLDVAIGEDDR